MHIKLATDYARHQLAAEQDIRTLQPDQIEKVVQNQVKAIMSEQNFPLDEIMNHLTQEIDNQGTFNLVQDLEAAFVEAEVQVGDRRPWLGNIEVEANNLMEHYSPTGIHGGGIIRLRLNMQDMLRV